MEYQREARLFLERTKKEVERLEEQILRLTDLIVRLEDLAGPPAGGGSETERERPPASSPSLLPAPGPDASPETDGNSVQGIRPVGEIAEEVLRVHGEAMSLDDLYRAIRDRADLAPSRDLKNAIRVSLIRRRPRILSERRGWFRFVKES